MTRAQSILLTCDGSEAIISTLGAEALRWRVGDKDLLWTPDPAIWDRTSPILFPTVGWCRDGRTRIDGRIHQMPVHGFAASQIFEIAESTSSKVVLVLRDNTTTRSHYPFAFELRVTYTLSAAELTTELVVTNNDDRQLPVAFGFHPGFALPFAGGDMSDYHVEFEQVEDPRVPVIAPGGLFSNDRRDTPLSGRMLPLSAQAFEQEAMCFLDCRSRSLKLVRTGHGSITLSVQNLQHLAIWSKPGASFVSLEAWSSHGDRVGFSGELHEKPGMRILAAGQSASCQAVFAYHPEA